MRITVGGVLLTGGVAAFVVMGPLKSIDPSGMFDHLGALKEPVAWVQGFIKGEPVETAPVIVDTSTVTQSVSIPDSAVTTSAPVEPVPADVPASAPAPVAVPVAQAPAVQPAPAAAPAAKKSRSRRRRVVPKDATVADDGHVKLALTKKKPAPRKMELSLAEAKLMDTYVALKLKSGREVKGILRAKSKTDYTIELPGMGPFTYPIANVDGVTPVQ